MSPHVHPHRNRAYSPLRGATAKVMVKNSLKMSRSCFSSMGRLLYVFADICGPITMQSVHSSWIDRLYSYSSYKLLRNQILKQVIMSKEKSLTSIHNTHILVCFMYVLLQILKTNEKKTCFVRF